MKITLETLYRAGACGSARIAFQRLFGKKGGTVTKPRCLRAAKEHAIDWDWAALHLIHYPGHHGAYDLYYGLSHKALKAFKRKMHLARARVRGLPLYDLTPAQIKRAQQVAKAQEKARADYRKAKAVAFYKASLKVPSKVKEH